MEHDNYLRFWAPFKAKGTDLLNALAASVQALGVPPCEFSVSSNDDSDEFFVVLACEANGKCLAAVALTLKDGSLEEVEDGVGIHLSLHDARREEDVIDVILNNWTDNVWLLTVSDMERQMERLDTTDLTNRLLAVLRAD